jgi:ATP-dependent Zn protease
MKNYSEVPSSAIDNISIDTNTNQVVIKYKSSEKNYTYSTENAASFDQQLLAEFDSEDISVGRFINQSVNQGTLQLIQE